MLSSLALIALLQAAPASTPSRSPDRSDDLALQLSARGARILVSAPDEEFQGRQSRPAPRCYSQGEVASATERLCLFDCEGTMTAMPVPSGRSCPILRGSDR